MDSGISPYLLSYGRATVETPGDGKRQMQRSFLSNIWSATHTQDLKVENHSSLKKKERLNAWKVCQRSSLGSKLLAKTVTNIFEKQNILNFYTNKLLALNISVTSSYLAFAVLLPYNHNFTNTI
jgi:hypothetical protein